MARQIIIENASEEKDKQNVNPSMKQVLSRIPLHSLWYKQLQRIQGPLKGPDTTRS